MVKGMKEKDGVNELNESRLRTNLWRVLSGSCWVCIKWRKIDYDGSLTISESDCNGES